MTRFLVGGSVLLALVASLGLAQGSHEKSLKDLTLEELLQIPLVTPTTRGERAAEAPAVISVLTAAMIRDLGVNTLYEALSYLPGVQVMESYFGYTMVNIRGVLESHYNNKVLLMVNGVPTREAIQGSFHLEIIPIGAIDRIELVRGPGSALYGTNAFAGVINIITKKGNDDSLRQLQVGGGSFTTRDGSATWGGHASGLDWVASASARRDDGWSGRVRHDEQGKSGSIDFENDVTNGFVALNYKGFSLTAAGFDQTKGKYGITPVLAYSAPSDVKQDRKSVV